MIARLCGAALLAALLYAPLPVLALDDATDDAAMEMEAAMEETPEIDDPRPGPTGLAAPSAASPEPPGSAVRSAGPPFADLPPYPTVAAFAAACQGDLTRLCPDEPFRMAAIAACLRRDPQALSAACRRQQEDIRARSRAIQAHLRPLVARAQGACAQEVKLLCGEAKGVRGACLRVHQDKLTPACDQAEARLRAAYQELRRAAAPR